MTQIRPPEAFYRPLLETLSHLTQGRTLQTLTHQQISDVTRICIPITALDKEDRSEKVMKRYICDWLRKNKNNISMDVRLKKQGGQLLGKSIEGFIEINFWPAAPPVFQAAAWQ